MGESGLLEVDGVRVGIGGSALLLATATSVATGMPDVGFTATLAAVTGICSVTVQRSSAILLGVTGWALCTGFGINELGELTFAPTDLLRLAGYVGGALAFGGARFPAQ